MIKYTAITQPTDAEGRQLDSETEYQLTLNIPTYTKCAKIYQNLMLIVKKVDADRRAGVIGEKKSAKSGNTRGGDKDKLNLSYVDQLV